MRKFQAHVADDWMRGGVQIGLLCAYGDGVRSVYDFTAVAEKTYDPSSAAVETVGTLFLDTDAARALYEALAEHFGHAGHDVRALRRDYDAERRRVDIFIEHLTNPRVTLT